MLVSKPPPGKGGKGAWCPFNRANNSKSTVMRWDKKVSGGCEYGKEGLAQIDPYPSHEKESPFERTILCTIDINPLLGKLRRRTLFYNLALIRYHWRNGAKWRKGLFSPGRKKKYQNTIATRLPSVFIFKSERQIAFVAAYVDRKSNAKVA